MHQDADGVSIGIVVYNIKGELVGMYSSICEAADKLNVCASHLNRVVNGKRDTIGGYVAFKENVCQNDVESRLSKIKQNPIIMGRYCKVEIAK